MADDSLANQLSRLRVRAGNPSLRDLEKLTDRQGRRMSRASIQDKFSGTSGLKMVQVLALVRACADYAHSIGAPLPSEDTDELVWQERAARPTAPKSRHAIETSRETDSSASQDQKKKDDTSDLETLIPPLINAGMDDIANLARQGAGQPLEEWLPTVVVALGYADMDYQGFLNLAAQAPPGQIVKILESIGEDGPENVGNRYFQTCLLTQHPSEIPKILVALRRTEGELIWYAHNFVDAILGYGDWPGGTRLDLADVLRALRAATLKNDADKLAENIGLHAWPRTALATAGAIPEDFFGDRELILHAGSQGAHRLMRLIDCLKTVQIEGLELRKTLEYLLAAVPRGEHAVFSQILNEAGMKSEAQRLLELEKENPF